VTQVSVRSLVLTLVLGSVLLAAACTNPPSPVTPTDGPILAWERVALPGDLSPVTLASDGTTLLVGAQGPGRPRAHLLSAGPGGMTEIPLTPHSPYAFEGRWLQVVAHDGRIDAIAGARGGAHGNHRWTTWSGTVAGVTEQEQPFGVFGSYGAGDLAGIAYAGRSPVVLGAWQSDRTGLDIAVWTRDVDRWSRHPSTDTALGSTKEQLVSAAAITSRGDGLALAGSVTHLGDGSVRVEAALWTSDDRDGPWTRTDLPHVVPGEGTAPVEAQGATCSPRRCLVSGTAGGRFTLWEVSEDTVGQPAGIPDVAVTENAVVLAPVMVGEDVVVVVPSGSGSTVVRRSGGIWSLGEGPEGRPVATVVHGGELWVVTTDVTSTGSLARATIP
jgi:hypothetical protein